MNIKRTWIVASATVALAGFAGAGIAMAADDVELQDPRHAPAVQLPVDPAANTVSGSDVSGSDSPRSADTAADSPGEPGYVPPAPAPAPVDSANTPAPAPAPAVDSANSPAPAPAKPPVQSDNSADSPASAQSANSAD